jgi:hypothetical protein
MADIEGISESGVRENPAERSLFSRPGLTHSLPSFPSRAADGGGAVEMKKGPPPRALGAIANGRAELCKACHPDAASELGRIVQQIEGCEVVAAASVIAPALATTDQDAGVAAGRGLAYLHVEVIGVQDRLS